jgi:hypothetical protein
MHGSRGRPKKGEEKVMSSPLSRGSAGRTYFLCLDRDGHTRMHRPHVHVGDPAEARRLAKVRDRTAKSRARKKGRNRRACYTFELSEIGLDAVQRWTGLSDRQMTDRKAVAAAIAKLLEDAAAAETFR